VWALLLEKTHPNLATDVIYVAGDRVVTDPLCKPFSMGRNLFCVHSKKRMDDFPELKAEKQKTNRRTLSAMLKALREVGPPASATSPSPSPFPLSSFPLVCVTVVVGRVLSEAQSNPFETP
jgi:hypothetical protein